MTWRDLIGWAEWAVILVGGLLVLRQIAKLVYRRKVTRPFQMVRVKRRRFVPAFMEVYRTCGDCGKPSRLAVNPEDFEDVLAGDLPPSRCEPCRAVWLATCPLLNRPGLAVGARKPVDPAL